MGRNHRLFPPPRNLHGNLERVKQSENIKIIYCEYGIELSFCFGRKLAVGKNALSEEVHVKSPQLITVDILKNCGSVVARLESEHGKSGTGSVLCRVGDCYRFVLSDAPEILKEGRKELVMCGFSIWCLPKTRALVM